MHEEVFTSFSLMYSTELSSIILHACFEIVHAKYNTRMHSHVLTVHVLDSTYVFFYCHVIIYLLNVTASPVFALVTCIHIDSI